MKIKEITTKVITFEEEDIIKSIQFYLRHHDQRDVQEVQIALLKKDKNINYGATITITQENELGNSIQNLT